MKDSGSEGKVEWLRDRFINLKNENKKLKEEGRLEILNRATLRQKVQRDEEAESRDLDVKKKIEIKSSNWRNIINKGVQEGQQNGQNSNGGFFLSFDSVPQIEKPV